MTARTASAIELATVARSHHITLDWTHGWSPIERAPVKEELHPIGLAQWNGATLRVELSADRYLASSGWTPWRVIVRGARHAEPREGTAGEHVADFAQVNVSDTARRALTDALEPLVLEWLKGDEYPPARRRAIGYAFRRELRDTRSSSSVDVLRRMLDQLAHELTPAELENLTLATDALEELTERTTGEPLE